MDGVNENSFSVHFEARKFKTTTNDLFEMSGDEVIQLGINNNLKKYEKDITIGISINRDLHPGAEASTCYKNRGARCGNDVVSFARQ